MAVIHKTDTISSQMGMHPMVKAMLVFGLGVLIIICLVNSNNIPAAVLAYAVTILVSGHVYKKASIAHSGSQGEDKALSEIASRLSDDYHIFVGVKVHEKMESDLVITGPKGVFIVEIKNYTGEIEGGVNDQEWTLHKTGQEGGQYTKKLRSPLRQLRRNLYILSQYLKIQQTPIWLDGQVYFVNNNRWVNGCVPDKCVTDADVLAHIIKTNVPRRYPTVAQLEGVNASLEKCISSPAMAKNDFEAKVAAFSH